MPRPKLSNVSLASLQAEIERRKSRLTKLVAQREALNEQIAELGTLAGPQPAPLAPTPAAKPGKKPKARKATGKLLGDYVARALAAAPNGLGIKEIEAKVLAAGYPTTAESIYKPITKVLSKGFKRVERGVYAVQAAVKAGKQAAQAALAPVVKAKAPAKRGVFLETAEQFILGQAKGKGATTAQLNKAWKAAGRRATASPTLSHMFKAKKIKREPLKGEKGFLYTAA